MKQRCCFVASPPRLKDALLNPGNYTMYYYGPSAEDDSMSIVESFKGQLMKVPRKWVKVI